MLGDQPVPQAPANIQRDQDENTKLGLLRVFCAKQAEQSGQEQAAASKAQVESQLAAMMEAQGRLAAECQAQAEELQQARQRAAEASQLEQQAWPDDLDMNAKS